MYLLIVMLFVAILPAAAFGTPTAQQSGNFNVSVAGTAVGSIPHQIDLKVTQLPGGQLSEVSSFAVSPEDVVQVKQRENLIVSTSPDLRTHQVTVINMQGVPIDLVPLPSNVWSLQGLLPGVYTLNVNVAMSSSGILGTYETVLAILKPNQQPLPPTTIISQITIEQTEECPKSLILVNGNCTEPPTPPVCTPDGPPCPPCPKGVEAGWCADEDERQDTGDDEEPRLCFPYEGPGGCNDDGGSGGDDKPEGGDGGDGGDSVDPFDGLPSFPDNEDDNPDGEESEESEEP